MLEYQSCAEITVALRLLDKASTRTGTDAIQGNWFGLQNGGLLYCTAEHSARHGLLVRPIGSIQSFFWSLNS